MAKGIKRKLGNVRERVEREVLGLTKRVLVRKAFFSAGPGSTEYSAGYRDALDDVLLALDGITPDRHGWWEDG